MWKNVHPVYDSGILTHNPLNTSLLPLPLYQGNATRLVILPTYHPHPVIR